MSPGRGDPVVNTGLPKGAYLPFFKSPPRGGAGNGRAGGSLPLDLSKNPSWYCRLPNLTQSAGDDYFSDSGLDGRADSPASTRSPNLRVVAWTSASQLRGREQDLEGIRQQLQVGAILRGSVRRSQDRVRVTAQLIDSSSGHYLWSETYDRKLENVFLIQEEMARAIVEALHLKLTPQIGGGGS